MKPGHAAALALAGWYLLVPPVNHDTASIDSPIIGWTKIGVFESEKTCKARMSDHEDLIKELSESGYARTRKLQKEVLSAAECVDENDRRVQGWNGGFIGAIR